MKIAIIGAGPAGLSCALALQRKGFDISIFERRSAGAAQGSGVLLQSTGLSALQLLGLRARAQASGQVIQRIRGVEQSKQRTVIAVDYRALSASHQTIGISRSNLWQLLREEQTRLQIPLRFASDVTRLEQRHDSIELIGHSGASLGQYDLAVDASGANTRWHCLSEQHCVSRTLDYGSLWSELALTEDSEHWPSDQMSMVIGTDNLGVGILPTEPVAKGKRQAVTVFFNLMWRQWNETTFESWKASRCQAFPQLTGLFDQLQSPRQLHLAKFRQHTLSPPFTNRVAYIGDAAHSSHPQLGQGVNMSLLDSVVLAHCLDVSSKLTIQQKLQQYARLRRAHIAIYQSLSRLLLPFYQSQNQHAIRLRNWLYPLLWKLPLMDEFSAYILSGQLGHPLKHLKQSRLSSAQSRQQ